MSEKLDTIVIGAGQAGLSAGYHLAKRGKPFVIVDAADRVGGSWLNRWDSLKLFTPSIRCNLPGLPLGGGYRFPSKDEMLDYVERYVATFELPVRLGVKVDGLFREGPGFRVTAGAQAYDADHVILATGCTGCLARPTSPAICPTTSCSCTRRTTATRDSSRRAGPAGGRRQQRRRDRHGPGADPPGADGRAKRR